MPFDHKKLSKGRVDRALRVLAYGMDGIGKSTFAAGAPDPFFIDANRGSHRFDNVQRYEPETWTDVKDATAAVERGDIKCKTVVYDTLGDIESMSHVEVLGGSSVAEYKGGYGKGDDAMVIPWREFTSQLERIVNKGINVIIVAHARIKSFNDPSNPSYDRFEVAARPTIAGMIRGFCDYVLFAREEVLVVGEKNKPSKATTNGVRYLYTSRKPAYDAKSRGTTLFPDRIPLSWSSFEEAIKSDATRSKDLEDEIDVMLAEMADKDYEAKVREYVKQYPSGLPEARNRVAAEWQKRKEKKDG